MSIELTHLRVQNDNLSDSNIKATIKSTNLKIKFINWTLDSLHKLCKLANRQQTESPWNTTVKAWVINPFVNLGLTVFHLVKTIERIAKTIYYLVTTLISALLAVGCLGKNKKLNELCFDQSVRAGVHFCAAALSTGFMLGNILTGLQGLICVEAATKNERTLFELQNSLTGELSNKGIEIVKKVYF